MPISKICLLRRHRQLCFVQQPEAKNQTDIQKKLGTVMHLWAVPRRPTLMIDRFDKLNASVATSSSSGKET
jgi:hypothetical protein